MKRIFIIFFFYIITLFSHLKANNNRYEYSSIIAVPDLSFFNHVYTGLDILEQMDFELLKDWIEAGD